MFLVIATGAGTVSSAGTGLCNVLVYTRYTIVCTDTLPGYRKYIRRWYSRYWQISSETSCPNGFCVSIWKVSFVCRGKLSWCFLPHNPHQYISFNFLIPTELEQNEHDVMSWSWSWSCRVVWHLTAEVVVPPPPPPPPVLTFIRKLAGQYFTSWCSDLTHSA